MVFLSDDLALLHSHNSYSTEFNRLIRSRTCLELKKILVVEEAYNQKFQLLAPTSQGLIRKIETSLVILTEI